LLRPAPSFAANPLVVIGSGRTQSCELSVPFEALAAKVRIGNPASIAAPGIQLAIGLSVAPMLAAATGFLPPLIGALLQEGIDILVIANAKATVLQNVGRRR
jgi:hypothetical protein